MPVLRHAGVVAFPQACSHDAGSSRKQMDFFPRRVRRLQHAEILSAKPLSAVICVDRSFGPVAFIAAVFAASRAGIFARFRVTAMETSGVVRPNGRSHCLKPGQNRAHSVDTEVSTVSPVLHARSSLAGSPVENRAHHAKPGAPEAKLIISCSETRILPAPPRSWPFSVRSGGRVWPPPWMTPTVLFRRIPASHQGVPIRWCLEMGNVGKCALMPLATSASE